MFVSGVKDTIGEQEPKKAVSCLWHIHVLCEMGEPSRTCDIEQSLSAAVTGTWLLKTEKLDQSC